MKHIIDVIEFPKSEDVKKFTIENPEQIYVDFNKSGLFPRVILPSTEVSRYINENKVYYLHKYGDIYSVKEDIYACIFVYNDTDKLYHIAICQNYIFIANEDKNKRYEFIDLTARLNDNSDYWISSYCQYNFEMFHCYQTNLTTLTDTWVEAICDMLEQNIKHYTYELGIQKAEVVTLSNKDTYEKEYNKLLEEKLEEIKEDINCELRSRKENAQRLVDKFSAKITDINEELNTYKQL